MPLVKIHVLEGRYDEKRLDEVSAAIQAALVNTLHVPCCAAIRTRTRVNQDKNGGQRFPVGRAQPD